MERIEKQQVIIAGIGMGSTQILPGNVKDLLRESDCVIGAERMLECARELAAATADCGEKTYFCEYSAEKTAAVIEAHGACRQFLILMSGDPGFYSGAKTLRERLDGERYEIRTEPGVSSVSYLAARLNVSWEDAALVSLHGKEENFIRTIHRNRKTFLLLGGSQAGKDLLDGLREYRMEHVTVQIGRRLSYPDEEICCKGAKDLTEEDLSGLCTVLVENHGPCPASGPHVRDEAFIRGKVPMTKEEVRCMSIARLELDENAVVYDVGAGTGSVSVEAALSGCRRVYAVEKNPEALELLRENRRKFFADAIQIVPGNAPEVLADLEAPTHVFIGGSGGALKEILKAVLLKNPQVRIVINAASLETLAEVTEAVKEGILENPEITQTQASRGKVLGEYHMMSGLNPVYIISAGGRSEEL